MQENITVKRTGEKKVHIWGMLCHLTAFLGITGIPFAHIFGPLVVWLLKKNTHPFVNEQGKESLNFQLSMTIYALVAAILIYIKIGLILLFVLAITNAILVIIASIKAGSGETFHYPFKIRLIK